MNQFMSKLVCVCKGFHHVLLKYGHENAEMQKKKKKKKKKERKKEKKIKRKFDDVTLQ